VALSISARRAGDVLLVGTAAAIDLVVWGGDRLTRGGVLIPMWVVPTLTPTVYATLLLRWRHPVAVFVCQWVYGLAGLVLPSFDSFAGLLTSLHAVARRGSTQAALAALGACAIPFSVNSYNAAVAAGGDLVVDFAGTGALWVAVALTVWGLGRLAHEAERRAESARRVAAAEAVRAERLRLARDLHDIVTNAVSAMILQAAGAQTMVGRDWERVRAALEVVESAGVQAMAELHRLLGLLRAADPGATPHDDRRMPTLQDIDGLVALARASGVDVCTAVEGRPATLDPSVDLAAYRLVQEALTNTVKHAGRGARAHVSVRWDDDRLTITVRDQGGREDPLRRAHPSPGYGLTGLAERIAIVGGELEAGRVDGGFVVKAEFPASGPAMPSSPP
jgi:signal transduction histidine kinase